MSHPFSPPAASRTALLTLTLSGLLLLLPLSARATHDHGHASSSAAHDHGHSHSSAAHDHGHSHGSAHDHGHASASDKGLLVLNDGKKWVSDAPLRKAMKKIAVLAGKTGVPEAAAAKRIYDGIHKQVSYMVNNCKLEEKADAVLHALIADMLVGATALTEAGKAEQGINQIRQALARYPEYFNHPGWGG
jgi:ABC-type Zn2+ transport system substrate-binding protein/surface adhesin